MKASEPDFVTVTEAARRLDVDPRQIRRWLPLLSAKDTAKDTQRTHKGQPVVTVRLSAVEAVREGRYGEASARGGATPTSKDRATDTQETRKGQARDVSFDPDKPPTNAAFADSPRFSVADLIAEKDARIADRESEIQNLRGALTAAQETAKAALDRLAESERRASVLIAATAGAFGNRDTPRITSGDTQTGDSVGRDEVSTGGSPPYKKPLPWWRFGRKE